MMLAHRFRGVKEWDIGCPFPPQPEARIRRQQGSTGSMSLLNSFVDAGNPAPLNQLLIRVQSDQPAKAEITPLDYNAARVRGNKILNRHRAHQTFKRLVGGQGLILFAMADFFGIVRDYCAGLIIDVDPKDLATSIGMEAKSIYRPLRALEEIGAIRRIKRGGPDSDAFELVMPPEPDDELLEDLDANYDRIARATRRAPRAKLRA